MLLYNNLGINYNKLTNYETAIYYFKKSISLSNKYYNEYLRNTL